MLEDHADAAPERHELVFAIGGDIRAIDHTRPSVGCSSRLMVRSRLDLPAPERPMMPKMEPAGMSMEMSLSASTRPADDV